jgi:lysozyme
MRASMVRRILLVLPLGACLAADDEPELATTASEIRVCADGPTVEGIDVSYWQGAIDWDAVAADGVEYAFIRTSHGLGTIDTRYEYNWAEAQRVGLLRGTYQYFSPTEDVIAQADLVIDRLGGAMSDGDLPPVLDVEAADGATPEQIVAGIHTWSDRIEAALGVTPLIYTAKYFWQDSVGAPDDFLDHPLWIANYTTDCPLIADPWTRWDFWQYTSTGSVAGITGNVDRDVWNGTLDELRRFAWPNNEWPGPDGGGVRPGDDDDDTGAGGCNAAGTGSGGALGFVALALALALALTPPSRRTASRRTRFPRCPRRT